MIEIILALVIGILVGKAIRRFGLNKQVAQFTFVGVMALLFVMGTMIGSNGEVLANLPNLGAQALVLALLCSLGSVLFSLPLSLRKK